MSPKVVRSTSKGQITLPKSWRSRFKTDNYLLQMEDFQIVIKPLALDDMASEKIIFDADRDNKGKGIPVKQMIKLLKKL